MIDLHVCFAYHVAMVIVQRIDQWYKSAQEVSSLHTQLRNTSDYQGLKILSKRHIVGTTPVTLTQLLESELGNILGLLWTWNGPSLSDLDSHPLSKTAICQFVPHPIDVLVCAVVVVSAWIVEALHTHCIKQSIINTWQVQNFKLFTQVINKRQK